MSDPIGTYTFLPWVRQGLANRISGVTTLRPSIDITLEIDGTDLGGGALTQTVQRSVALYGPGDIIGVDAAQISRVEPPAWTTAFEPNYFAAIEFYDEDFAWRYTPAAPDGRKLLPWLALVVLEEEKEFSEGGNVNGRPLSYIDIKGDPAALFADAAEAWAWAHAHFNADLSTQVMESDAAKASLAAQNVISTAPDTACSRLLCPRKLKPKTGYHAFLVPAFESGRLAGLGHDPQPLFDDAANALTPTSSSWGAYAVPANRPDATSFPYYFRWFFRTAEDGDFESLVRLLKAKPVDSRVGQRDMDVSDPAPNLVGIDKFDGVLRLGGALKAPYQTLPQADKDEYDKFDGWANPYPQPFQSQLAAFVNLADSYQQQGPDANADPELDPGIQDDPDPLITPPLYGRWHALTERLLSKRDGSDALHRTNWVHDLNLDPRWRVGAGLGTKVVQDTQEALMESAWKQIGDVLEANRRIRQAQLAKLAGQRLHRAHLVGANKISSSALLLKTAPLRARVVSNGVTLRRRLQDSPLGVAMTSTAMRRAMRPAGRVATHLSLRQPHTAADIVARTNEGVIKTAPPKLPPKNILTPDDLAAAIAPTGAAATWAQWGAWLEAHRWIAGLILLVLVALALLWWGVGVLGLAVAAALVAAALAFWNRAQQGAELQAASDRLREDHLTPAAVDTLPGSSSFVLAEAVDPRTAPALPANARGQTDNDVAARFKTSLRDQFRMIDTGASVGRVSAPVALDLTTVATHTLAALDPDVTVPRWTWSGISIPPRIRAQTGEDFVEVMAYPEFDLPMYEPLVTADKDGFVPNLHLVEPDSITLLESNQRFIESYLVGLNHEFARELLWREYPTDQRGSYFRQFWDVRKKIAEAADKAAAREQFKDIKPLHQWPIDNDLGDNDNRQAGQKPEEDLVLVIRGELLKKYPNTIISAQAAKWQLTNGVPDKGLERQLDDSVAPMFPLYEARVAPDIYFFGFALTAEVARGDDTVDDKPGWFFRIEEVSGDARFGFDQSRDPGSTINVWNDLAWPDIVPALADGAFIKVAAIPPRTLVEPTGSDIEKHDQWESDRFVPLDAQVSAAELAYISLQTPVIMAVHASEMLPAEGA
ncbi:MAG TPA: hypothetical protein VGQ27_14820 [Steroidobacteraceae bacterium]|nr:hypothetical protein [Steroidobacteraceae bacterium]